jgi:hypothetical protein
VAVQTSRDRGATWTRTALGSTSVTGTLGRSGAAAVAASGTNVVVAWIADGKGTVKVRRSTNSGRSWTTAYVLGNGAYPGSRVSAAARGDRLAVAWTRDLDTVVRVRTTRWQPAHVVLPSAGGAKVYAWPWTGQVALASTSRVGIAFEACWNGCADGDPDADYRSDVLWRESANNGVTWARSQVVIETGPDPLGEYEQAYRPSVIWPVPGTRYVMASRWYGPNLLDNVVIVKGTGTP